MGYWKLVLKDGTVLGDTKCTNGSNCYVDNKYVIRIGEMKIKEKKIVTGHLWWKKVKTQTEEIFIPRFIVWSEDVKYRERIGD